MPEVKVKPSEVYSKTNELRSRIQDKVSEMESSYSTVRSSLDGLDSASNATYIQMVERNKHKSHVVAETLDKLLSFLENSANHVEQTDKEMKGVFDMQPTPPTGGIG